MLKPTRGMIVASTGFSSGHPPSSVFHWWFRYTSRGLNEEAWHPRPAPLNAFWSHDVTFELQWNLSWSKATSLPFQQLQWGLWQLGDEPAVPTYSHFLQQPGCWDGLKSFTASFYWPNICLPAMLFCVGCQPCIPFSLLGLIHNILPERAWWCRPVVVCRVASELKRCVTKNSMLKCCSYAVLYSMAISNLLYVTKL